MSVIGRRIFHQLTVRNGEYRRDTDDTAATRRRVQQRFPDVADRIEFVSTTGDLSELGGAVFDLVISKDSMEHYASPERFVPSWRGVWPLEAS